ncbi:MAG: hypothetical protein LQ340_001935 [Diploschistes diacapsis]|nr:MAG: hypothetical protein LQ340_001935 [Diploschistes diacapsis]
MDAMCKIDATEKRSPLVGNCSHTTTFGDILGDYTPDKTVAALYTDSRARPVQKSPGRRMEPRNESAWKVREDRENYIEMIHEMSNFLNAARMDGQATASKKRQTKADRDTSESDHLGCVPNGVSSSQGEMDTPDQPDQGSFTPSKFSGRSTHGDSETHQRTAEPPTLPKPKGFVKHKRSPTHVSPLSSPTSSITLADAISNLPSTSPMKSPELYASPAGLSEHGLDIIEEMRKMQKSFLVFDETPAKEIMGQWPVTEEQEAVSYNGLVLWSNDSSDDGEVFTSDDCLAFLKKMDERTHFSEHYQGPKGKGSIEEMAVTRFSQLPRHLTSMPAKNDVKDDKEDRAKYKNLQRSLDSMHSPYGPPSSSPPDHDLPLIPSIRLATETVLTDRSSPFCSPIILKFRGAASPQPEAQKTTSLNDHVITESISRSMRGTNRGRGLAIQIPSTLYQAEEEVFGQLSDGFSVVQCATPQSAPSMNGSLPRSSFASSSGSPHQAQIIYTFERQHHKGRKALAQAFTAQPQSPDQGILSPLTSFTRAKEAVKTPETPSSKSSSDHHSEDSPSFFGRLFHLHQSRRVDRRSDKATRHQEHTNAGTTYLQPSARGSANLEEEAGEKRMVDKHLEKRLESLSARKSELAQLEHQVKEHHHELRVSDKQLTTEEEEEGSLRREHATETASVGKEVRRLRKLVGRLRLEEGKLRSNLEKKRKDYERADEEVHELSLRWRGKSHRAL